MLDKSKKRCIFAPPKAQMAESVDALVSNTSGFTSIPVRPRVWVRREAVNHADCNRFFDFSLHFG